MLVHNKSYRRCEHNKLTAVLVGIALFTRTTIFKELSHFSGAKVESINDINV